MLPEKQYKNLQFLRDMSEIFIPSQFTYWCHNTMYKPKELWTKETDRRNWAEIPTEMFTLKKEMSFVTKVQRIQSAVDFNRSPSLKYANTEGSLPFQIRVIQPKRQKLKEMKEKGVITEEQFKSKMWQNNGLGDYRHPKLPAKTNIYIIGSTTKDEISGQKIDVIYGVVEEDIDLLVKEISKKYNSKCQEDSNYTITNGYASESDRPTVIMKNLDESRLKDTSGKIAGYKIEYKNLLKQRQI